MESMSAIPSDPAADLAAAESARRRLTGGLRMPAWFYTTLGVATAVQIGAVAAHARGEGRTTLVILGVAAVVALVALAVLS